LIDTDNTAPGIAPSATVVSRTRWSFAASSVSNGTRATAVGVGSVVAVGSVVGVAVGSVVAVGVGSVVDVAVGSVVAVATAALAEGITGVSEVAVKTVVEAATELAAVEGCVFCTIGLGGVAHAATSNMLMADNAHNGREYNERFTKSPIFIRRADQLVILRTRFHVIVTAPRRIGSSTYRNDTYALIIIRVSRRV
jgi:hypothetical protein